jgi:hypothetical protein
VRDLRPAVAMLERRRVMSATPTPVPDWRCPKCGGSILPSELGTACARCGADPLNLSLDDLERMWDEDHSAYVVQSTCDRIHGLVLDVERHSRDAWDRRNTDLARRLDQLANNLASARVLFS